MTRELTNSMRNKFNSCHRAFKIAYEDLIKPIKTSDALTFGTAMHSLLEEYWGGKECEFASTKDEYTDKTVKALYEGYISYYANNDEANYERVGAELRFDVPLVNPETMAPSKTWHLAGKIDAIAIDKNTGMHVIVEHKTTSMDIAPGSDYWKKLSIDGQISGYFVGAQKLGYDIDVCLYDVIRKPTIYPSKSIPVLDDRGLKIVVFDDTGERVMKKAKNGEEPRQSAAEGMHLVVRDETADEWYKRLKADIEFRPDFYYQRVEVARSNNDLEEYLFDMWAVGREIADAEHMNRWSRNPQACSVYGSCEYFDVCTNCASLDDVTLFTKKEKTNEEL